MSIELKNVTYTYMPRTPFERTALHEVSICIKKDEFTAIVGHTGSGKSTLVQHLNGLLLPTNGQVFVEGTDINKKEPAALAAKRRVGMVFQYPEHQLFEESVYKDIAFGPRNMELAEEEVERRVRKAMEFVNLDYEEYKEHSPFQLSGGQMRRVAIAGVIALQPDYLVLDEPTAGLDPRGNKDLLAKLSQLHKQEKIGIVLVSHNMDDVARLADRVILLNQSRVVINSSAKTAFRETKKIRAAGLDIPQVTALLQTISEQGLAVDTDVFQFDEAVEAIFQAAKGAKSC